MAAQKLTTEEIDQHLGRLPGWSVADNSLTKTFQFPNFVKAMEFVNQLAISAESVQHHPDIDIRYNKVTITLSTHDAGGITENDTEMAAAADDLAGVANG